MITTSGEVHNEISGKITKKASVSDPQRSHQLKNCDLCSVNSSGGSRVQAPRLPSKYWLQFSAQHVDNIVGGDNAGQPAFVVDYREREQVVFVETLGHFLLIRSRMNGRHEARAEQHEGSFGGSEHDLCQGYSSKQLALITDNVNRAHTFQAAFEIAQHLDGIDDLGTRLHRHVLSGHAPGRCVLLEIHQLGDFGTLFRLHFGEDFLRL